MMNRTPRKAPRDRSGRRSVAAGATLTVLSFGAFAAPSAAIMSSSGLEAQQGAVQQEDFRTEVPELGGYSAEAISSPMSMLLFEPTIPVPAGPGEPHGEMHGSYSKATLGTGPASRGLGSSTWPGPTAGDGLSAFDENIPPYPFKASATYPDGPFDATQGSEGGEFGMSAFAHGIDVFGRSDGGGELYPGFVTVGNVSTVSTTTVVEGAVVAETIAAVSDMSILDGLITMDGTQTRLVATSNGETAVVDGVFEVSGLKILGVEYEMTEKGLVAKPPSEAPDDVPDLVIPIDSGTSIDLKDAIGIKVETAPMIRDVEGAKGRISTRGMQITIDTSPLRQAAGFVPLADIIGNIPDPGVGVPICDGLPPEMGALPCFNNPISGLKANLFTLVALQPETQFLFGGGQASASASLPFSFTAPPLPNISAPAPSTTTTTTTTTSFPQPSFISPPMATSTPEQSPVVATPAPSGGAAPQLVALAIPAGLSRGIDAGAMVVGIAGIGLLARGGRRLTMAAMYGTGAPASVGAASVPDLRAFARGEQI